VPRTLHFQSIFRAKGGHLVFFSTWNSLAKFLALYFGCTSPVFHAFGMTYTAVTYKTRNMSKKVNMGMHGLKQHAPILSKNFEQFSSNSFQTKFFKQFFSSKVFRAMIFEQFSSNSFRAKFSEQCFSSNFQAIFKQFFLSEDF